LVHSGLSEIDRWLERLRSAMEANYDRLDQLLATLPDETQRPTPRRKRTRKDRS
jgi:hypothetical protein